MGGFGWRIEMVQKERKMGKKKENRRQRNLEMAQRRVKYEGNKGQGEEGRCRAPTDAGCQQMPGANRCRILQMRGTNRCRVSTDAGSY